MHGKLFFCKKADALERIKNLLMALAISTWALAGVALTTGSKRLCQVASLQLSMWGMLLLYAAALQGAGSDMCPSKQKFCALSVRGL